MKNTDAERTPSFVLTMPLRYSDGQQKFLDRQFQSANNLYNRLTEEEKGRLAEVMRSDSWTMLMELREQFRLLAEEVGMQPDLRQALRNVAMMRRRLLQDAGFTKYAFESQIQAIRREDEHAGKMIGSHVAQKIADSVWQMFEKYLYGNGKHVSFRSWTECMSIEGKDNKTMLSVKREGMLYIRRNMELRIGKPKTDYEREALTHRIKYCRLIRIPWKKGWLYKVQLILEGTPPQKTHGEKLGTGRVGLDIGTQTIAAAGEDDAALELLAPGAEKPWKELRRVNRAMDRSRRTNNPGMFAPDGTILPKDKRPPDSMDENGRIVWKDSRNYRRLADRRRYLYAKTARTRRCEHQRLANRLLQFGDEFYIEKMNFPALAKRAARPKEQAPGVRPGRRKRFGKSVANRAPALFTDILEAKVTACGGTFVRIETAKAKASQYTHTDKACHRAKLSQRTKTLDFKDGKVIVQRDLYSAFLLMNTNDTHDGFIQERCEETFEHFLDLHDKTVKALEAVSGLPSSMGIRRLRTAH